LIPDPGIERLLRWGLVLVVILVIGSRIWLSYP
jgi:hypothetical protein